MKRLLASLLGILTIGATMLFFSPQTFGATPARGDFPGIYNATTTDLVLNDGYGSALAVDRHGRLMISTSTSVGFLASNNTWTGTNAFTDITWTNATGTNSIFTDATSTRLTVTSLLTASSVTSTDVTSSNKIAIVSSAARPTLRLDGPGTFGPQIEWRKSGSLFLSEYVYNTSAPFKYAISDSDTQGGIDIMDYFNGTWSFYRPIVFDFRGTSSGSATFNVTTTLATTTITDRLITQGAYYPKRTVVNATAYSVAVGDHFIAASSTSATSTYTLPQASTVSGRCIVIYDRSNNAFNKNITVTTTAGDTISGSASAVINANGDSIQIISDGVSNWEAVPGC